MATTHPKLKIKNKTRFTLFCLTIFSFGFSSYLFLNSLIPQPTYQEEQTHLSNNTELPDDLIASFIKEAPHNKNIQMILDNLETYPLELVELAIKNEEAIEFVADYKAYSEGATATVGFTQPDIATGQTPLFLQWDSLWGYSQYGNTFMALAGCAPTTVAMAVVGLTGDTSVTPRVVADFAEDSGYYVPGVGTSWDLINIGLEAFGLQSEVMSLSADSIINTLNQDDLIIMSVKPGTFTQTGHFILLTGITEDNKITLHDPNSPKHSQMQWDIDVFLNEARNLWRVFAN